MIMREAYFCSIYHFEGAKSTFKVFFFFLTLLKTMLQIKTKF